jgi:hypothetical protein
MMARESARCLCTHDLAHCVEIRLIRIVDTNIFRRKTLVCGAAMPMPSHLRRQADRCDSRHWSVPHWRYDYFE